MAAIQDGLHDIKVEDWPKLCGVWFLLQVSMLILWVIIAVFVISGNGCHPRWPTRKWKWKSPPPKMQFWVFPSFSISPLPDLLPPSQPRVSFTLPNISVLPVGGGDDWGMCSVIGRILTIPRWNFTLKILLGLAIYQQKSMMPSNKTNIWGFYSHFPGRLLAFASDTVISPRRLTFCNRAPRSQSWNSKPVTQLTKNCQSKMAFIT